MPNDYATLTELKQALPNLASSFADGSQDGLLTALITRASRALDRQTAREPGAYYVTADDTRYYDGPDSLCCLHDGCRSLWVDELADVPTSVYVSPDGNPANYALWSASDYWLWPYSAQSFGL